MRVVADSVNENYPAPSVYLERAVLGHVMAKAHPGRYGGAEGFIEKRFPKDRIAASLIRGVATVGETDTSGWAAETIQSALRNYLVSLAPMSAAAELIRRGINAPVSGYGTATYPARSAAPVAAPWVDEAAPIPVTSRPFASVVVGPEKKLALIAVLSAELAQRGDGEAIVSQVLREDISAGLDVAYFSATAPSDAAHAGLLYGVSPLAGYAGGDVVAVSDDLARLASAVAVNGSGQVVFIMSAQNAATFPLRLPDLAARVTVLSSPAVSNTRVIAADPAAILHSSTGIPDINVTRAAVVHMSDDPQEIVSDTGPTTADPVRSLWQTDCIGIRLIADIAFAKRRSTAVAYVDGISWGEA